MALSIKTDEADALARALAAETHETLTEAVTVALRERLARVRRSRRGDLSAAIAQLQAEVAASRDRSLDGVTDDEIIGYDENGLPS